MLQQLSKLHLLTLRLGGVSTSNHALLSLSACGGSGSIATWAILLGQRQQLQLNEQQRPEWQNSLLPALLQQQQQHLQQQHHHLQYRNAAQAALSTAEPCMLTGLVTNSNNNSRVVQYPYPIPPLYSHRKWQLQNLEGRALGAAELPGDVFSVPVRIDIMHQVSKWLTFDG